jgi:hypothetical protein
LCPPSGQKLRDFGEQQFNGGGEFGKRHGG